MTIHSDTASEILNAEPPEYPMVRASGCPFDPPPMLGDLRAHAPITRVRIWDGSSPWLVTRHDDQRALLADARLSADTTTPGFPYDSPVVAQSTNQLSSDGSHRGAAAPAAEPIAFINMDNPEHARQRRMITSAFAIRRVEAMRPAVQQVVDDLIDDMLAGPNPADLVDAFAMPVPARVICEMLGVPYADHDFFQTHTSLLAGRTTTPEQALQTFAELAGYLDGLIGERLVAPADDLLTTLAEYVTTCDLTRRQAVNTAMMLLFGGQETTANMIALGTLALLENPDQLARVQKHSGDADLIASTVEELLRYLSVPQGGRRRVALEDIEIAGVTIRAGDGLILANDVANRDPAVFDDPDRLDIDRNARRHLTFGFGVHQCLGQPLARLELQVVYSTLYRRIPTLRLATELNGLPFKNDAINYGVYEMPVAW